MVPAGQIIYNLNGGKCLGNMISAHEAHTWPSTENHGIQVTTDGDGVYKLNGTATENTTIFISVDEFVIPYSIQAASNCSESADVQRTGSLALNSSKYSTSAEPLYVYLHLYKDDALVAGYALVNQNAFVNAYCIANKTINKIAFYVAKNQVLNDLTVAPAIYNDGRTEAGEFHPAGCYPDTFVPMQLVDLPKKSKVLANGSKYDSVAGWYRSPDFEGEPLTQLRVSNRPPVPATVNLYAKWKYKVQYADGANQSRYTKSYDAISGKPYKVLSTTELQLWNLSTGTYKDPLEYLAKEGFAFKGYCIWEPHLDCPENERVYPGDEICDYEGGDCVNIADKIKQNYIELYAQWEECPENETGLGTDCVCKKNYYKDGENGCVKCPEGQSTVNVGATSKNDCKYTFDAGAGQVWMWPDNVTPGEPQNLKTNL